MSKGEKLFSSRSSKEKVKIRLLKKSLIFFKLLDSFNYLC